jgi:pyridoxine 5-phosphate synthase
MASSNLTKLFECKLSVNINKVALLRNQRKGNFPDLIMFAQKAEEWGADGITVHPRPDERHIRYSDVPKLKEVVKTELNVEGNPTERFLQLIEEVRPHQVTLVPDPPGVLTSDCGWDTIDHASFLIKTVQRLKRIGVRVSIFVDPEEKIVEGAKKVGADRVELYTGDYAKDYLSDPKKSVEKHVRCAQLGLDLGLGINAGHDLNLQNLEYYHFVVPGLQEVSIGHAFIADCLYLGLEKTIQTYRALIS